MNHKIINKIPFKTIFSLIVFGLSVFSIYSFVFAQEDSSLYILPYPKGKTYICIQGNCNPQTNSGNFSHCADDYNYYAFDFNLKDGDDVVVSRAGKVLAVKDDSNKGCDDWSCVRYANYVLIDHQDGTSALYLHLKYKSVKVSKGEDVLQGQVIAKADTTGYTTGSHLHFQVQKTPKQGQGYVQKSLPISFSDTDLCQKEDDCVPKQGKEYIAGIVPPTQGAITPEKPLSFWEKVRIAISNFWDEIKGLFSFGNQSQKDEQESKAKVERIVEQKIKEENNNKESNNEKWDSKLLKVFPEVVQAEPGTNFYLSIAFQNTGNTSWKKDQVSLNILGGEEGTTIKFYHPSWKTKYRPASLNQEVKPGEIATFSFQIHIPENIENKGYILQFLPAYLYGSDWYFIGQVPASVYFKPLISFIENPPQELKKEVEKALPSIKEALAQPEIPTQTPSPSPSPPKDNISPITTLSFQTQDGKDICFKEDEWQTQKIKVILTSKDQGSSGIKGIYYQINNESPVCVQGPKAEFTLGESGIFKIQYYSQDNNNNQENINKKTIKIDLTSKDVVINEIAWMGTKTNAADEWIELYNTTNKEIKLTDWKIIAADGQPKINLEGKIPAHSYYLLERTDDNTISDIQADKIYTGALANTGESLRLVDKENNIIDMVDCSQGWPAGDSSEKISMERIDPWQIGSDPGNWESNNKKIINGKDAQNSPIFGTPKSPNSTIPKVAVTNPENDSIQKNSNVQIKWKIENLGIGVKEFNVFSTMEGETQSRRINNEPIPFKKDKIEYLLDFKVENKKTYNLWISYTNILGRTFNTEKITFKTEFQWAIFPLDQGNVFGRISLALDKDNNPAIAYIADDGLRYLRFNGEKWEIPVIIDTAPVENKMDEYSISLKFDHNNNPTIAYAYIEKIVPNRYGPDGIHEIIKLVKSKDGGVTWESSTVKGIEFVTYRIKNISLAFDQENNPGIAVLFNDAAMRGQLYYFFSKDNEWTKERIDETVQPFSLSLIFLGNKPIIFYSDLLPCAGMCGSTSSLAYLYFDSEKHEWGQEILEEGWICFDRTGFGISSSIDKNGGIGLSYIRHYGPHLYTPPRQYYEGLKYIYFDTKNGLPLQIVSKEEILGEDKLGEETSLVFDQNNNPLISYYSGVSQNLWLTFFDGQNWQKEVIDFEGDVGRYSSLAITKDNIPIIAYYDQTNKALKVAILGWYGSN